MKEIRIDTLHKPTEWVREASVDVTFYAPEDLDAFSSWLKEQAKKSMNAAEYLDACNALCAACNADEAVEAWREWAIEEAEV